MNTNNPATPTGTGINAEGSGFSAEGELREWKMLTIASLRKKIGDLKVENQHIESVNKEILKVETDLNALIESDSTKIIDYFGIVKQVDNLLHP